MMIGVPSGLTIPMIVAKLAHRDALLPLAAAALRPAIPYLPPAFPNLLAQQLGPALRGTEPYVSKPVGEQANPTSTSTALHPPSTFKSAQQAFQPAVKGGAVEAHHKRNDRTLCDPALCPDSSVKPAARVEGHWHQGFKGRVQTEVPACMIPFWRRSLPSETFSQALQSWIPFMEEGDKHNGDCLILRSL